MVSAEAFSVLPTWLVNEVSGEFEKDFDLGVPVVDDRTGDSRWNPSVNEMSWVDCETVGYILGLPFHVQ